MVSLFFVIFAGMLLMFLLILPESWLKDSQRNRLCRTLSHSFFWILILGQILHLSAGGLRDNFQPLSADSASTLGVYSNGGWLFAQIGLWYEWLQSLALALALGFASAFDFADGLLVFDAYAQKMNLLATVLAYGLYQIWSSEPSGGYRSKNRSKKEQGLVVETVENNNLLGDVSVLFFFLLSGAYVVHASQHFMLWFIGLEIVSLILYVFAASNKKSPAAVEAGYKYFIAGSVATAFMLLGIALIYRSTFSLEFLFGFANASFSPAEYSYFQAGLFFLSLGILQKIAVVPFHFWSIDLYQGTPVRITAIMIVLGKVVYFGALFRLVQGMQVHFLQGWEAFLLTLAALSMLVGSLMAWRQQDFKRMMAYSSITYSGYFLLLLWTPEPRLTDNVVFLLAGYGLANLGIFAGLSFYWHYRVDANGVDLQLVSLRHLLRHSGNRLWIFCIFLLLLSLAGIPPLAGFFGKVSLFSSLIAAGSRQSILFLLLLMSSALALVAYLKLIFSLLGKSLTDFERIPASPTASPTAATASLTASSKTENQPSSLFSLLLEKSANRIVLLLCLFAALGLVFILPLQI